MSGQKTLLNFFQKKTPVKRVLESPNLIKSPSSVDANKENEKEEDNNIDSKRPKLESEEIVDEVAERIERNRYEAKMKLSCRHTFGLINNFGISWFKVLEPEFSKVYFLKLSEFVAEERKKFVIYPPENEVFSWTKYCTIDDVKVVILGQDPYHGPNQAHGLCFSVKKNVPAPPSLVNIYKEMKNDIEGFTIPQHGTLIGWATQGVLLLNACLTVRKGEANSHKDRGWENFTDSVIKAISSNFNCVVFMLWGSYAQKKSILIDSKKHLILNAPHPSPLSASRGWYGCKHFSKANEYLKNNGKIEIDWRHLPTQDEYTKSQNEKL